MTDDDARPQFNRRRLLQIAGVGGLLITTAVSIIPNSRFLPSGRTGPRNVVAQLYPATEEPSACHVGVATISAPVPDRIDFAVRVSGRREVTLIELVGCDGTPFTLWQSDRGTSVQSVVTGTVDSLPEGCQSESATTPDRSGLDGDIAIRVSLADSDQLAGRFR